MIVHDINEHVSIGAGLTLVAATLGAHAAGIEAGAQIILTFATIGAMCWAMAASRAKKRYYDRLNEDEGQSSGV